MDSWSSPNPTASTRWAYGPLKPSLLNNKGPVALLYQYSLLKGHTTCSKPHDSLIMVSPLITNVMLRKKHGVVVFITNICYIFFLLRNPCLNCVVNLFDKDG
jgi:hypothetical protein